MNFCIKLANNDLEGFISGVKKNDEKSVDNFLKEVRPQINKTVNKYHGSGVDRDLLEMKAENLALNAAKKYNPNSENTFNTYLYSNMKNLYREVNKMQNIARIPENVKRDYSHKSKDKKIYNINESYHSGSENDLMSNVDNRDINKRIHGSIHKSMGDLSFKEREVVEHLYGINGKKIVSDSRELQNILGISSPRLSTLKKNISKKIGPSVVRDLKGVD